MNLHGWRKISFQLAADLQALQNTARERDQTELTERADALRLRVEDRRFTVAVVGDFRRGKSTFINALLGAAVLPSDVAPTTATVNRVTYGSKATAELRFWDGRPNQSVPIDELHEHVTKLSDASAARALAVREAVVRFPVRFCRNDVDLLDTPGLGDEATMTAVTLRELPHVDAAIMVIMADSPFSESEGQFLDRLLAEGLTEILFVVSAIDRIRRPEDRQRVVDSIRARIQERLGAAQPPLLFAVSALNALEGRLQGAPERIEASGMPEFEAALETFLTRADTAGLARRLEQAERLAVELNAVLSAPPPPTESPASELARLGALLLGLEAALETQGRRNADGVARATVGFDKVFERYPAATLPKLREIVNRANPTPFWPQRYDEFIADLARLLRAACEESFARRAEELEAPLLAEAARHVEGEARIATAAAVVLAHVATSVRAIGGTPQDATAPEVLPPSKLDLSGIGAALAPPAESFEAMLKHESVLSALAEQGKKSAFDNLFSLDFGGLAGRWLALALPRVVGLCQEHWNLVDLPTRVRDRIDAHSAATRARFEPIRASLRTASGELLTTRERATVHRDRADAERAQTIAEVETLRLRLAAIRTRLTEPDRLTP